MIGARESFAALVAEILASPRTSGGYRLVSVAHRRAIEITVEKDGARFVVWLRPAQDGARCFRSTTRFKVGHNPDPPDQRGYELIDHLCARVSGWEGALTDVDHSGLFQSEQGPAAGLPLTLEWLAVRSGLKPACRNLVRSGEVAALITGAAEIGLHVEHTEAATFLAGFRTLEADAATTILHVGRSPTAAAAAAGAERAMMDTCARGARATDDEVRALGAALGYPACCIDAFLPVRDLSNAEIRFAALCRTPGQGAAVLNDMIAGAQSLVSHCVCRYDCPPSVTYAAALLEAYRGVAAAGAAALLAGLRGLMVVFRSEGPLRLDVQPAGAPGAYRLASVQAGGPGGARMDAWRAALATADSVAVQGEQVQVLRGGQAVAALDAPAAEVQIRLFT